MDGILQNVSVLAIWGSLSATAVLGCFLAVQAAVDPPRRGRFAAFAAVMGGLAALDFLRIAGAMAPGPYEVGRVLWAGGYAGAVLRLFGHPPLRAMGTAFGLAGLGLAVFFGGAPDLATTVVIPLSYGITAWAHGREYRASGGYASALLAAATTCVTLMCALYLPVIATRDPLVMGLGYLHYALTSILAVILGWVHLPRELRGQAPVRMEPALAFRLFALVVGLELLVQAGLFFQRRPWPVLYIAAQAAQAAVLLAAWFRHRHQLVIHAANVGQLLEARTADLDAARAELARQNELLAERLAARERELLAKAEVIERQRRLELAAQTAGQVAHDIQNLISPVLARLEAADAAGSPGELREATSLARRRVNEVLELNTQLLSLSRRGRAERLPVPLAELAREVADRFKGRRLSVETDGAPWVRGSWAQIARAVSNLVANAFESGHDEAAAPVVLRVATMDVPAPLRARLGVLSAGRCALVEVVDRGRGIPDGDLDRIFEPFFSSKAGPRSSGSGLGLSIVAAVVDDHQGALDLETGPEGSRFRLFLAAAEPPSGDLSCSATVLVVDDDREVLRECEDVLPRHGWTVIPAQDGAEALRVLQARDVDVLLLDLRMPRMDGLETLFGALHVRPGARAVVHTAHVTAEEESRLRVLGVAAILRKPAGAPVLLRALRDAAEEKRARHAP